MNRSKLDLKTIAFSLGLAAGMMLPASASAQGVFGNMLDNYYEEQNQASRGALLRGGRSSEGYSTGTEQFGNGTSGTYNIATEQFGNPDAPLGSGLFIMAAAGAAYALKKRKMNK